MSESALTTFAQLLRAAVQFLLILGLSACGQGRNGSNDSSTPVEVIGGTTESLPSVTAKIRSGQWLHGVNLPWDNYRTDFGFVWEDRGLGNQGPSGIRRETRGSDAGAKRLYWASRSADDHCLGVDVALTRPNEAAMIYFQIDDLHDKANGATVNLAGQSVSVQVFLPKGIEGPRSARTGVVVFMQDDDWTYAQSGWRNIDVTSNWVTLSVDVSALAAATPGFDATQIRKIGLKVSANSLSGDFRYEGPIYVDNLKASRASELQFDFDKSETRSEREFKNIAKMPATVARVWLLGDAASLRFDDNGLVLGLSAQATRDLDELVRLARVSGLRLVPVLLDFLAAAESRVVDGKKLFGHADLFTDPAKRRSFIENAVSPILDRLGQANEVVLLDLVNEPEWTIRAKDLAIPDRMRPPEIRVGGSVDLVSMKILMREVIALRNAKGLKERLPVTVGSASPRWVSLWQDVGLDVAQFHFWNGPGQIDEGTTLQVPPLPGPVFIGEVSEGVECVFYERARELGYSGVFPWAYRAKDVSTAGLGAKARACLRQFADRHPDLARL